MPSDNPDNSVASGYTASILTALLIQAVALIFWGLPGYQLFKTLALKYDFLRTDFLQLAFIFSAPFWMYFFIAIYRHPQNTSRSLRWALAFGILAPHALAVAILGLLSWHMSQ